MDLALRESYRKWDLQPAVIRGGYRAGCGFRVGWCAVGMGVGEGVVFVFLRIFGGVWFGVGGGEVGCGSIILCGLDTFLIFPDFLRLVVQQLVRKLVCTI